MTIVVVHLRGHFCDSLDFFFRIRLHALFAKDGAVDGDLGAFYLTVFVVKY